TVSTLGWLYTEMSQGRSLIGTIGPGDQGERAYAQNSVFIDHISGAGRHIVGARTSWFQKFKDNVAVGSGQGRNAGPGRGRIQSYAHYGRRSAHHALQAGQAGVPGEMQHGAAERQGGKHAVMV